MDWEDPFTERGANPFSMQQSARFSSFFRGEAGLNTYYAQEFSFYYFIARGKLSYVREQLIHATTVRAALINTASFIYLQALVPNENLFSPGVEFFIKSKAGGYISLLYDGLFGGKYRNNALQVKLGHDF